MTKRDKMAEKTKSTKNKGQKSAKKKIGIKKAKREKKASSKNNTKTGYTKIDKMTKSSAITSKKIKNQGLKKDINNTLKYPKTSEDTLMHLKAGRKDPRQKIIREDDNLLESYTVTSDFVVAVINIRQQPNENVPVYEVKMPIIQKATKVLLEEISEVLAEKTTVSSEDITDPNKMYELRVRFFRLAFEEIHNYLPDIKEGQRKALAGILVQKIYGMGELDIIMSDNFLEEVCINRADQPVCVYHKTYGWVKTDFYINDDEQTYNYAAMIGRKAARDINSLNPIMDAQLSTGDRVAATLFPVSAAGNTITFRRFARNPWTITHLVNPIKGVMSLEMASVIWQALEFELNIMVCGGTASGKTSFLNAFCALMPKNQRIISVEDTREFILPQDLNWNWIPLVSRKENAEGHGSISMLDLIFASLRMRPDRIIVGEVRNREQAETMFEAMHTGHSVYTTMHADTVEQIVSRLLEPPIAIPKNEVEALNLIVVQHRDRQKNVRRTLEIAEVLRGSIMNNDLKVNYLYRWRPRTDKFEKVEESIRLVDDLNLRAGMTPKEIEEDIQKRMKILQWLLENNVYDTDMVGKVMKIYYRSKSQLLIYIDKGMKVEDVIKE